MEFAISVLSKFHGVPKWLREVVPLADLDKYGFITKQEFAFLVEILT